MKKLSIALLVVATAGVLAGCKDFLDQQPLSTLSSDTYYADNAQANSAVLGAYDGLALAYNDLNYILMSDISTDIGRTGPLNSTGGATEELSANSWTSQTSVFNAYWVSFYSTINRANALIQRVPAIPSSQIPPASQTQYVAEAKFIRALSYFNLVKAFGDVPLIKAETTSLTDGNAYKPRSPKAEVFAQIHTDLDEAAAALPATYNAANLGRATAGSANAVNAEVYLFEKNYQKAREKALLVINSTRYSLLSNFQKVITIKNGSEHVFSIQYDYDLRSNQIGRNLNPQANPFFFFYEGIRGQGAVGGTPAFLASYPRTYRQQLTVVDSLPAVNTNLMTAIPTQAPAITRHVDFTVSTTYRGGSATVPSTNLNTNSNFNIFRYAGVLLTFAEADFEVNGPTAQSLGYLNAIRKRARTNASDVEQNVSRLPDLTLAQLNLAAILTERRNELAFEGHRRWDLLRRGEYATALAAAGKTAGPEDLLFPIPFNQVSVNPALTQNQGY